MLCGLWLGREDTTSDEDIQLDGVRSGIDLDVRSGVGQRELGGQVLGRSSSLLSTSEFLSQLT